MASKRYNGWSSRTAWNIALWILNTESTYRLITELAILNSRTKVARFLSNLWEGKRTPDGYKYSYKSIHEAIADFEFAGD